MADCPDQVKEDVRELLRSIKTIFDGKMDQKRIKLAVRRFEDVGQDEDDFDVECDDFYSSFTKWKKTYTNPAATGSRQQGGQQLPALVDGSAQETPELQLLKKQKQKKAAAAAASVPMLDASKESTPANSQRAMKIQEVHEEDGDSEEGDREYTAEEKAAHEYSPSLTPESDYTPSEWGKWERGEWDDAAEERRQKRLAAAKNPQDGSGEMQFERVLRILDHLDAVNKLNIELSAGKVDEDLVARVRVCQICKTRRPDCVNHCGHMTYCKACHDALPKDVIPNCPIKNCGQPVAVVYHIKNEGEDLLQVLASLKPNEPVAVQG